MARGAKPLQHWREGTAYEPYVGRWSRLVARQFLKWLEVPQGLRWLDIGCGTGALSFAILEQCNPAEVMGVDPSTGFLRHARETLLDDRVTFHPGSAENLPAPLNKFDAAVSGLVLNFTSDPKRALGEAVRVVEPGGLCALYVWDYAEGMQMMRFFWDAAVELDPTAAERDEGRRFPICQPDALASIFSQAGLENVETTGIEVETVFSDFMDFWSPFLSGEAPAPGYCMSLPEETRLALRDLLKSKLPKDEEGRIPLTARAWAVKGRVPA